MLRNNFSRIFFRKSSNSAVSIIHNNIKQRIDHDRPVLCSSLVISHLISRTNSVTQTSYFSTSNKIFSLKEPSDASSGRGIPSGYESESAAIQSSFEQLSAEQLGGFESFDEEEEPIRELSNALPMRSQKPKSEYDRNHEFIDFRKVSVRGGRGGDGMICFLSLYANPNAGPSGGDGGNGGHVIFEGSKNIRSLNRIKRSYVGNHGENGQRQDMDGASADHLRIPVPVGTLVKDSDTGKLLADICEHEMLYLAAKGGSGGKGNHYFVSNQNRHPKVAEVGADGESKNFILELKILAEAGLVGLPNAGKSTLLAAVSRAKPKIAAYPFTTLKPSVGIVQYDDNEQLAIADLPGIIEGASQNKGLGLAFLKHVERCVCLLYVVDISGDISAEEQLKVLMSELENYRPGLSKRPKAIIVNKMDTPDADKRLQRFKDSLTENGFDKQSNSLRIIPISAKYGKNISDLLIQFRQIYDWHRLENFSKF